MSTGIITSIVGSSTSYLLQGDGGAATSAAVNVPRGVAVDSVGNVYVSDTLNYRVRKVTIATGIINSIAGSGTATSGGFSGDGGPATSSTVNRPCGLAVDSSGRQNDLFI